MDNVSISRRYAQAIYEVAVKNDKVFEVFEMLSILLEHIKNDEDFKKFLTFPVIEKEEKKSLINKIYDDIDDKTLEILDYLIDKDRLLEISSIYNEYTKIYYEAHQKLIVTAIFPKELTNVQKEKLESKIKKMKKKDVVIHYIVDKKLIGGGIIRINDDLIDGSISSQINSLKH